MWSTLAQVSSADFVTEADGRCLVGDARTGKLLALDGKGPAVPVGSGWTGLRGLAGLPGGNALLVDRTGVLWRIGPAAAEPARADVVCGPLGLVTQMSAPTPQTVYVLGRAEPRTARTLHSPGGPIPPPARLDRSRILRVDLVPGTRGTVAAGLVDVAGLVVGGDESTAYLSERSSGSLISLDLATGLRTRVTGDLRAPGACGWLDEANGLLIVAETGGAAVVDTVRGQVRHLPGAGGTPRSVCRAFDHLVLAVATEVIAMDAATAALDQVLLSLASSAVHRGGYTRVDVDLGLSGLAFDDLEFDIVEGREYAAVSHSRDDLFDPAHPRVVLLAGPVPGTYTMRARTIKGADVTTMPFTVTDAWAGPDGPPMAFSGTNPLYASGGTWGSLFGGVFPFEFGFALKPVSGPRRVALIHVGTSDTTLPAGATKAYRDALVDGVVGPDGVTRSVAAYYGEVADGRLSIVLAAEKTVTLSKTWGEYTKQFSDTDTRFGPRRTLMADAMWQAQDDVDFRQVDTAVFVVASPNGGVPLPPPPGGEPGPAQFTWPVATSGTFVLNKPMPPLTFGWWWKTLPVVVMPAEWLSLDSRGVLATLSHEIGHTLGMGDLYGDTRDIGGFDLMSDETGLPSLSMPHQAMLGWIDPAHLRRLNFRLENPVDELVVLTATELLGAGGPPPGERAAVVVEVTEGWRYYFEYRSTQNAVPGQPELTQVADQSMPADRRVVGTDVTAGWYRPPVARRPVRLRPDDGDGQGAVLAVGDDYVEWDAGGNSVFTLDVLSADDDRATVRVRYQPVPAPEPPWPNGPDPSIRPWPGGDNWQSPDIVVENGLTGMFPNVPWADHDNRIIATVRNTGTIDATDVRVGFWVKDFTVSDAGPETFLGWVTDDVPAGGSTAFTTNWVPAPTGVGAPGMMDVAHYCVVVRIAPHTQGTPPRGEVDPLNNEAQSNYAVLLTMSGSPFSRVRLPVQVSNPHPDRSVDVALHVEQKLPYFLTYLDRTAVRLGPGATRDVEVMVECLADQPPFNDTIPPGQVYGVPNVLTAVAVVTDPQSESPVPIGGASVLVRAARRTALADLDISRTNAIGRVQLADGAPVTGGDVLIATLPRLAGREVAYYAAVDKQGRFSVRTPDFASFPAPLTVDVTYLGDRESGPTSERLTLP